MDNREIIKAEDTNWEDYWVCTRCEITSETKDRMCPCPRGSCDAELVGEIEIKTTIYKLEPKYCNCGKGAKWLYMPGFGDDSNPYICDDCVNRGCTCNWRGAKDLDPEDGVEGIDWKWVDQNEGVIWTKLDGEGREFPCAEYEYDVNEDNFKTI